MVRGPLYKMQGLINNFIFFKGPYVSCDYVVSKKNLLQPGKILDPSPVKKMNFINIGNYAHGALCH
jgi:hypothetical protein